MKRVRRAFWTLGSTAILVLLLAACGGAGEGAEDSRRIEEESTTTTEESTVTSLPAEDGVTGSQLEAIEDSLLEVMEGDSRLSLALDAYVQNGYDLDLGLVRGPPIAVLAPSDAAFEAWLQTEGLSYDEFLESDPQRAYEILGGQLIPGGLEGTSGEVDLPTLSEAIQVSLKVGDDGGIELVDDPQAEVIDRIEANNGVVYILDTFVIPDGIGNSDGNLGEAVGGRLEEGRPTEGDAVAEAEFAVPVSFTTEGEWFAAVVQPGAVILEYPERESPFTRALLILSAEPLGAEAVDGWVETQDEVTIVDRFETQVSGFDTVVYDLTYDGEGEVPFLSAQCCGGRIILRNTEYYRVWVIDIDAAKPLVVFSPVLRDDIDWYENAQDVVDSMEIG